jgi:hypothetical protein
LEKNHLEVADGYLYMVMTELTEGEQKTPLITKQDVILRSKTITWKEWFKGIGYFFAFAILYPKETISVLNQSVL